MTLALPPLFAELSFAVVQKKTPVAQTPQFASDSITARPALKTDVASFSKAYPQPRFGSSPPSLAASTVPDDLSEINWKNLESPTPSERGAQDEMTLKERQAHYREVYREKAGTELEKRTSKLKRSDAYRGANPNAKRAFRDADSASNRKRVVEWLRRAQQAANRDNQAQEATERGSRNS